MKLSEYAEDLLEMVKLYGDHDVVTYVAEPMFVRTARAPRLCCIAVNHAGREIAVPATGAAKEATRRRAVLTGDRVYVV